jgi:hypothetical protein
VPRALIFTLSSCSVNNDESDAVKSEFEAANVFEGVTLSAKEGSITPAGLILVFENDKDAEHIYGSFFCEDYQ